jgi:hypothetical protein
MAAVAARSQIIEIEPQVRPHFDWDLVVGVQMPLASSKPSAQFYKHFRRGRRLQPSLPATPNNVRLPIAIHAAPAISLEAENPQPTMAGVVAAFRAGTAAIVIFTLPPAPVQLARSAGTEFATARSRARPVYPHTLRHSL